MPAEEQAGQRVVVDFEAYVAERRPALLRWARAVAGEAHAAEDLLQDSLVRVLPRWESIREGGAADAYVRRTITRQYISWQRRAWRRDEVASAWLPEPAGTHDDALIDPDDAGLVWELVLTLPARQRATVVLRFYEQLSVAETAEVLGCSTGTVKSNTSRGLAALRRLAAETALAG